MLNAIPIRAMDDGGCRYLYAPGSLVVHFLETGDRVPSLCLESVRKTDVRRPKVIYENPHQRIYRKRP
jgi:hypothetical protein